MLEILDRHVLREFLLHLLLGLSALIGIYLIVDLFEKIDVFVDHAAAAELIFDYYAFSIPVIIVQVLPVAMLLASILALGQLRRFNEISAMQSCGRSPLRITTPLLVLALLISGGTFVVGEEIVPGAYRRQQETLDVKIKKKRSPSTLGRSGIRYMGRGGRVYVVEQFEPQTPSLVGLSIQHFTTQDDRQRMWKRLDAVSGRWRPDGILQLEDGMLRVFRGDTETAVAFQSYGDSRMTEQPDEFARVESDPFHMSRRQLSDYIRRIREGGAQVNQYEVDYHLRAAFPAASFIMVLLGSCLTLRVLRGGVALGFGVSLSLGFAYYGFLRIGQALGYTGHLHPVLSAWLGNIVFGIVGTFLFWKANR